MSSAGGPGEGSWPPDHPQEQPEDAGEAIWPAADQPSDQPDGEERAPIPPPPPSPEHWPGWSGAGRAAPGSGPVTPGQPPPRAGAPPGWPPADPPAQAPPPGWEAPGPGGPATPWVHHPQAPPAWPAPPPPPPVAPHGWDTPNPVSPVDAVRWPGPLGQARPSGTVSRAAAGAGGLLLSLGSLGLIVQLAGPTNWRAIVGLGAAGLLAAGVVLMSVSGHRPVSGAGAVMAAVAVPVLVIAAQTDDTLASPPSLKVTGLLCALLFAGLYAVGPWRGHTFHFALVAVAVWVLAMSFGNLPVPSFDSGFDGLASLDHTVTVAGTASLIVGIVYLGLGSWLHESGLAGMATPLVAIGDVAVPLGAAMLLRDQGDAVVGVGVMFAGAVVAAVGHFCGRRGSTWLGMALVAVTIPVIASKVVHTPAAEAGLVAVAGAVLVGLAVATSSVTVEEFDGG
ncbi:MAG TPA: hypothetical protein VFJ85_16685 [Acidimicrobiales bacterium]|nr:hypothetical protein [Acidimicrobiales bacterium]